MARSSTRSVRRRPFGVRLYLAVAFAAVALTAAGLAYLLVPDPNQEVAATELTQLALGRTDTLADEIATRPRGAAAATLAGIPEEGFSAWVFDDDGVLTSPERSGGIALADVPGSRRAVAASVIGSRFVEELPDEVTLVAVPILRNGSIDGALLGRSSPSPQVEEAIDELRSERLTALAVSLAIAILISFLIASAITSRIKRLADSAARISEGDLDEPLEAPGGRDEITDLGRALETMRGALRQTFSALREERDRLSAIFEALSDAVMVVQPDDEVRFFNAAAVDLIDSDGRAIRPLIPWLRRAARGNVAESDALGVGERVYSLNARRLPAEDAVLMVVRDRTRELQREVAERDFVSNAAHELRARDAGGQLLLVSEPRGVSSRPAPLDGSAPGGRPHSLTSPPGCRGWFLPGCGSAHRAGPLLSSGCPSSGTSHVCAPGHAGCSSTRSEGDRRHCGTPSSTYACRGLSERLSLP